MKEIKKLTTPLTPEVINTLQAGDSVRISGVIYTARDAAHKKMVEALSRGESLPADLTGQIIYYVGPTPAKPGDIIGSAGPTTSGRMDKYAPTLMDLGLSGMIGKGLRSAAVVDSMKKNNAVYFAAIGGAGAVIAKSIKSYEILAYGELASEAFSKLVVEDFPAVVVIDSAGNDFYKAGQETYCKE